MAWLSTPQAAIRAVLLSQIVMAGGIVVMDMMGSAPAAAPGMFAPPAQGPSVRPYRPDLRPDSQPDQPGAPSMRPMPQQLEMAAEAEAITLTGQIAPGDADRFLGWLDQNRPAASLVRLDSSGGSVSDALAIGRAIRSAGYDTEVGQGAVCMSACPYMLAGGVSRTVAPDGLVGVHQHYFGESTILPAFMAINDLQRAQAGVLDYLTEMGVDLRIMSYALRTPPSEINILDADLMRDLNLTTQPETDAGS